MLFLDVFLEGVERPVGHLVRNDAGDLSFTYARDDLPHPVSLGLPIREASFGDVETRAFFSNLLFENAQRDEAMARHGLEMGDVAGLLFHLGRDCPGALSVVPSGEGPGKHPGHLAEDYDPLSEEDLSRIMASLRDRRRVPDEIGDPSPLAGIQGKLALTRLEDGTFALPRPGSGAPTTHILKVPRPAEGRLVDHEHILMDLAARLLDHPVAETEILEGEVRGLLVARFDREIEEGRVRRIHQEDFCQALGLPPSLKYQRNGGSHRRFDAAAIGGTPGPVCRAGIRPPSLPRRHARHAPSRQYR